MNCSDYKQALEEMAQEMCQEMAHFFSPQYKLRAFNFESFHLCLYVSQAHAVP